jgi:hypothetical protein
MALGGALLARRDLARGRGAAGAPPSPREA